MIKNFRINDNRGLTHLLFWATYVIVAGFIWGYCFDHTKFFLPAYESKLTELPFVGVAAYTNMYLLLPKFFVKRKYVSYLSILAMILIAAAFFIRLIQVYYLNAKYPAEYDFNSLYEPYYLGKIIILSIAPVVILTTVIKLLQYWYSEQKCASDLLKEKLGAELSYLKAQVHPHFLFNTLNNLYSLTLSKSDDAPKMVLKLASLMSYTLHDSQSNNVPLEKEIAHIRDYIELEKIRYRKRLDISFNVYGKVQNVYIAPLILIPFIENAFKHGVSNETNNAWITIDLKIKDEFISIKVENSKNDKLVKTETAEYKNGIGLTNVKRRLDLLYPHKHQLSIEDADEHYAVDLKLIQPIGRYEKD